MLDAVYWTFHVSKRSIINVVFSRQVQYLVMLEGDSCCSKHCTGRLMCQEARHDMTPHHITRHDILQPTTLPPLTSPHNEPHYFISPRSQPPDIIHHITAHHITATDTPQKHNQIPPKHHHHTEQPNTKKLVWASHWLVAVCTFYRQILSLLISTKCFSAPNVRPSSPELLVFRDIDIKRYYMNNTSRPRPIGS